MVARGRGKKAAAAVASEAEVVVANGDVSQETEAASEVVAAAAPLKKGRQRGVKKETKLEVEEKPSVEVAEKPAKPAKAARGSKKAAPKGKGAVVEEDEKAAIQAVDDADLSENDSASVEAKPAAAPEKKAPSRKKKVDGNEKIEETEQVAKKVPRATKTKGAKKETVDSDGIPEDPAAAGNSANVLPVPHTNGTKKAASRKRGAPKVEEPEPVAEEPISKKPNQQDTNVDDGEEEELAAAAPPAKKSARSKYSKKEPKETKTKPAPKTKASKKAMKIAEEAEEEANEHDVLPEDEFVPEIEEEEENDEQKQIQPKKQEDEPKPKKVVKSKGSRKQVVPVAEEKISEPVIEDESEEPQESEADSASAMDEEQQQPTKTKGRKPTAAKKEKAPAKKPQPKKGSSKAKKGTKDEFQEDQQQPTEDDDQAENSDKINEENDSAADVVISKRKMNGTTKPVEEPGAEPKAGRGRKRAPIAEINEVEKKPGRGRKRAATAPITDQANEDETDGSKVAKHDGPLNPTKADYNSSDFTLDKKFNMKISSWNIAGLRAWLKKDGLAYLEHEQPDILCLQEIKCTPDQLPEEARIPGYHPYWLCMPGGYAGVAVYSKIMPINVEYGIGNAEHDTNGRLITAEYEKFYLINVYVPNSGRLLVNLEKRMEWEGLFREYLEKLEKIKPVIIAGDMNVSHKEIDLANPKSNTKSAGFTPQEREQMTKLLDSGYVDTFRHFHPDQKGAYTYWTYMKNARSRNVGWRLDYFILSERIVSKAVESIIRPQVLGSDHCPITLFLNI